MNKFTNFLKTRFAFQSYSLFISIKWFMNVIEDYKKKKKIRTKWQHLLNWALQPFSQESHIISEHRIDRILYTEQ